MKKTGLKRIPARFLAFLLAGGLLAGAAALAGLPALAAEGDATPPTSATIAPYGVEYTTSDEEAQAFPAAWSYLPIGMLEAEGASGDKVDISYRTGEEEDYTLLGSYATGEVAWAGVDLEDVDSLSLKFSAEESGAEGEGPTLALAREEDPPTPGEIEKIELSETSLPQKGGSFTVTVTGTNLPDGMSVKADAGGKAVYYGYATGDSGTRVSADIAIPKNKGKKRTFTISVSQDAGQEWKEADDKLVQEAKKEKEPAILKVQPTQLPAGGGEVTFDISGSALPKSFDVKVTNEKNAIDVAGSAKGNDTAASVKMNLPPNPGTQALTLKMQASFDGGKSWVDAAKLSLAGNTGVASVKATPDTLAAGGGESKIEITGDNLEKATAAAFLKGKKVDSTEVNLKVTSDTHASAVMPFPANSKEEKQSYTVKVALDGAGYLDGPTATVTVSGMEPAVTGLSATPGNLPANGGNSQIDLTGHTLPETLRVAAFAGEKKVENTELEFRINGGTRGQVSMPFPANKGSKKVSYSVRVSMDGGKSYLTSPAAAVTVNHKSDPAPKEKLKMTKDLPAKLEVDAKEETVTLAVETSLPKETTYEWHRDDKVVKDATGSELKVPKDDQKHVYSVVASVKRLKQSVESTHCTVSWAAGPDSPGGANVHVEAVGDAPKVDLADPDAFLSAALSEEDQKRIKEKNAHIDLVLQVELADSLPNDEINALNKALYEGEQVGLYLDISVKKQVTQGGKTSTLPVTELNKPGELVMHVPGTLEAPGRSFGVAMVHLGQGARLDSTFDEDHFALDFKSSEFSTYAITYTDTPNDGPQKEKGPLPIWLIPVIIVGVVVVVILLVFLLRKPKARGRRRR